jgi:hypothetical protein
MSISSVNHVVLDQVIPVASEELWAVIVLLLDRDIKIQIVKSSEWLKRLDVTLEIGEVVVGAILQTIPMGQFGGLIRATFVYSNSSVLNFSEEDLASWFKDFVYAIEGQVKGDV